MDSVTWTLPYMVVTVQVYDLLSLVLFLFVLWRFIRMLEYMEDAGVRCLCGRVHPNRDCVSCPETYVVRCMCGRLVEIKNEAAK